MAKEEEESDKGSTQFPGESTFTGTNESSAANIIIELTVLQTRLISIATTLFVLVAAIGFGVWVQDDTLHHWSAQPEEFRRMGPEALGLFRQHDANDDGFLDLREFEPLAHILVEVNVTLTYDLPIIPEDNVVTIKAYFSPLDIQTMAISENDMKEGSAEYETVSALRGWTKPEAEMKNFAIRDFSLFMPKTSQTELAKAYHITPYGIQSEQDYAHLKYSTSSSNRYYPPRVTGELKGLHNLLAMLHPRPFINTRFAPQGSMACLRAYNEEWLDIAFRIHTEFQLQEPPRQPFWFTPAQFKGRLIISKDGTRLKYFRMYVPNNRRLNVDMEWLKNDLEHSMEVDIGYMAEMGLVATSESRPATYDGYDLRTSLKPETNSPEEVLQDLSWTREVQVDVCEKAMEVVFYPFKTVEYYNYTEAYDKAAEENKLVHSIVLWGALDDQSC